MPAEGDTVTVRYESTYRDRPGEVSGVVKEVTDSGFILLENQLNWREVFDYEHDDETRLLRGARTRGDLGSRHGTVMGTVTEVTVDG